MLKLLLWVAKGPVGPAVGGRTGATGVTWEPPEAGSNPKLFEWITVLNGESLLPDMCILKP